MRLFIAGQQEKDSLASVKEVPTYGQVCTTTISTHLVLDT